MGTTTTVDRSPWTKPAEPKRELDRFALAVAELDRNGVEWRHPARAVDFVSAPDAVDMQPTDVANVVALTAEEDQLLAPLFKAFDDEPAWGGWADDDARWTLTPHELRKARQRKLVR